MLAHVQWQALYPAARLRGAVLLACHMAHLWVLRLDHCCLFLDHSLAIVPSHAICLHAEVRQGLLCDQSRQGQADCHSGIWQDHPV